MTATDNAKRFFLLEDDGELRFYVVAIDLNNAKDIIRKSGIEFGSPSAQLDQASDLSWSELSEDRVDRTTKCHTEDERGIIKLRDAAIGDYFCNEW